MVDGMHCLPIPTPFMVGRVNCYLIEDDPLTLVDVGPNSGKALDELEPVVEEFGAHAERDDQLAGALMLRHGIPRDVVSALRTLSRAFRGWGGSAPVDRRLGDGDALEFAGRTLRVLHRPGHSPSDTLFWDERRGVLLGGDHLLARVSSNPLLSRPLGGRSGEPGDGRPRALLTYMESLRATRAMPAEVVLAGHGDPVTDHTA